MKLSHFHDYDSGQAELCEKALVTTWSMLDDYHEHLVLIGGLVPRYLCRSQPTEPQPNTMDVDLGLSLGVRGTAHHRIAARLDELGFKPKPPDTPPGARPLAKFYRRFGALDLCIEFLADQAAPNEPTVQELDNMYVPAIPGIGRALQHHRVVEIRAEDLHGRRGTCRLHVAEVGPFLCLKLRAYGSDTGQRHGKDVFDIVHAIVHYDRGADAAVADFGAERSVNPAFAEAVEILQRRFTSPEGDGPRAYAEFCLGGLRPQAESPDFDDQYAQRVQSAALVGERLLQAAGV